jgi:hypothetical protein
MKMLTLGFEDVIAPPELRANADVIGVTVGRVDWTAFPWLGHEDAWSPWVVDTGRDYVGEAISAAGSRRVTLIVDVMVERWISRDPSIAGVDARGERSTEFAKCHRPGRRRRGSDRVTRRRRRRAWARCGGDRGVPRSVDIRVGRSRCVSSVGRRWLVASAAIG